MKVTDCQISFKGRPTPADAYGNNVAWSCPVCGHPLLFVCRKGWKGFDGKRTNCKQCGALFTIRPQSGNLLVIERVE